MRRRCLKVFGLIPSRAAADDPINREDRNGATGAKGVDDNVMIINKLTLTFGSIRL